MVVLCFHVSYINITQLNDENFHVSFQKQSFHNRLVAIGKMFQNRPF